jgi:hypothetical protein
MLANDSSTSYDKRIPLVLMAEMEPSEQMSCEANHLDEEDRTGVVYVESLFRYAMFLTRNRNGGVVRDNPAVNKAISGMTALGRVGLPDDIGPMIACLTWRCNQITLVIVKQNRGAAPWGSSMEDTSLFQHGMVEVEPGVQLHYVLSEDNRWINAQRIEVSGGMSISLSDLLL